MNLFALWNGKIGIKSALRSLVYLWFLNHIWRNNGYIISKCQRILTQTILWGFLNRTHGFGASLRNLKVRFFPLATRPIELQHWFRWRWNWWNLPTFQFLWSKFENTYSDYFVRILRKDAWLWPKYFFLPKRLSYNNAIAKTKLESLSADNVIVYYGFPLFFNPKCPKSWVWSSEWPNFFIVVRSQYIIEF